MFHVALRGENRLETALRVEIEKMLRETRGDVNAMGDRLGVSRSTAHRMVTKLGLRTTLRKIRNDAERRSAPAAA